jgi:hypothetical protein
LRLALQKRTPSGIVFTTYALFETAVLKKTAAAFVPSASAEYDRVKWPEKWNK